MKAVRPPTSEPAKAPGRLARFQNIANTGIGVWTYNSQKKQKTATDEHDDYWIAKRATAPWWSAARSPPAGS